MVSSKGKAYDGKYFLQTADIVLNDNVIGGATKEADGSIRYSKNQAHFDNLKRWQPIGMYGSVYDDDFEGIYDGGGHSISGIYCRKPIETSDKAYYYIGLFATCNEARISNLTIKDSFYSICAPDTEDRISIQSLGSLVGHAEDAIITNCHADNCVISGDGDVTAYERCIGGLIGEVEGTLTAKGCSYNGIVDAYDSGNTKYLTMYCYVGGLIGVEGYNDILLKSISIEDCHTSGKLFCRTTNKKNVYGFAYIGGVAGYLKNTIENEENPDMLRCTNRMEINAFGDDTTFPKCDRIWVSGISNSDYSNFSECINFGNINFGGSTLRQQYTGADIRISGISDNATKADNCFNYGDFNIAPMKTARGVYIGQWVSYKGSASNCLACNKITYSFQNGTPGVYTTSYKDPYLNISDVKSYTTINGKAEGFGINESDFRSQDYVSALNNAAGKAKYGLIKEDGFAYDGYLSLTSLGALANSLHGYGTETDPYTISNASDLHTLAYMVNAGRDITGNLFKLTANIDMTNEDIISTIGTADHPFSGIFDGCGHYIRGMKALDGYMFHTVTGTVKNLALDDFNSKSDNIFAGIAYNVGKDGVDGGTIENCYVTVTGVTYLKATNDHQTPLFGGICNTVNASGTVRNCYYIGNVWFAPNAYGERDTMSPYIGGIAEKADGTVENCYAVFNFQNDMTGRTHTPTVGGIVSEGTPKLSNNYYFCNISYDEQEPKTQTYDGATAVDSESKIDAAKLGEAWKKGVRHPVLKQVYHYDCKDYQGNDAALDPSGYMPTDNQILTLVPTAEQTADTKMWQLSNVAVYSADMDAEILSDFGIIPDTDTQNYPLRYKPTKEGVVVKGLANYPWGVKPNAVNWRGFCLPGEVKLSNLPDGCKLYVGGKLVDDTEGSKCKMNIVEVETVPAGVPFLLRYDNKTDEELVYITMTGDLVMTPQKADASSSLEGTFTDCGGVYGYYTAYEDDTDGETKVYMKTAQGGYDSFSAYVTRSGSATELELVDYLLLDEQSNETDDIIAANKDNTLNIKLRRDIKTGGWNTVCLPFGVSAEEIASALGANTRTEQLESVGYDATTGSVVMTFGAVQDIEAGKPYLVYPEKAASIFDFAQHTITGTTTPAVFDVTLGDGTSASISMVGSYGKAYLASTDDEDHYFIQQDKFYRATQANPVVMQGFRCWFKVTYANATSGTTGQMLKSARLIHSDGTVTNIKLIDTGLGTGSTRIYDIQGIQHDEMQRGLNIVGGKKVVR